MLWHGAVSGHQMQLSIAGSVGTGKHGETAFVWEG